MQETLIWSPVLEDSTYLGAAKTLYHNYWACTVESVSQNKRSHHSKKQWETHTLQLESSPHLLQLDKTHMQRWRPSAVKKKKKLVVFFNNRGRCLVLDPPKNLTNGHTVVNSKSERSKLTRKLLEAQQYQDRVQCKSERSDICVAFISHSHSARPTQAGPTALQSLELWEWNESGPDISMGSKTSFRTNTGGMY